MSERLTIVGLGGSRAEVSRSRAALVLALEGAASAGAETELLDIRELDLPMYDPDHEDPTKAAARLIESSHGADGMLWASPMYQGRSRGRSRTRWTGSTSWVVGTRPTCTTR